MMGAGLAAAKAGHLSLSKSRVMSAIEAYRTEALRKPVAACPKGSHQPKAFCLYPETYAKGERRASHEGCPAFRAKLRLRFDATRFIACSSRKTRHCPKCHAPAACDWMAAR